jgi:hypothetical protein
MAAAAMLALLAGYYCHVGSLSYVHQHAHCLHRFETEAQAGASASMPAPQGPAAASVRFEAHGGPLHEHTAGQLQLLLLLSQMQASDHPDGWPSFDAVLVEYPAGEAPMPAAVVLPQWHFDSIQFRGPPRG